MTNDFVEGVFDCALLGLLAIAFVPFIVVVVLPFVALGGCIDLLTGAKKHFKETG